MCVLASVLNSLKANVTAGAHQAKLNQTTDSLMASQSSLEEMSDLLLAAGDTVDRAKGLNLKNQAVLRHLEVTMAQPNDFIPLRAILLYFKLDEFHDRV